MDIGMKSLLLVHSRVMLLDCMYAGLQHQHHLHSYYAHASLTTNDEGGHRGEVVVVSEDRMCRFTPGSNIGTPFTGTACAHASLITDGEGGGREVGNKVVIISGYEDHLRLNCMSN